MTYVNKSVVGSCWSPYAMVINVIKELQRCQVSLNDFYEWFQVTAIL